jgi:hypothetical protein
MDIHVLVLSIGWYQSMPIATVFNYTAGDSLRVSLLHRSYMLRYGIGIGSELQVSSNGFIVKVLQSAGEVVFPPDGTVFDSWFLLKHELSPTISPYIVRHLFRGGIRTLADIKRRGESIGQIRGIGPVATKRILTFLR